MPLHRPASTRIKAKAAELGFELCGIAPADDLPELSFFAEWLARGYAGEMQWLTRTAARRADVRAVVPGARSVIVTGTLYNVDRPYSTEERDPAVGLVSRYAWGDDYHDVIGRRLDQLLAWMREEAAEPFEARAYVDTGPVQERVYAQYAGLGWIGKNACLINERIGSWLFLSEIICSLPLEPDTPAFDRCGTCTLCLEACPTGAIVEPHVIDSNRCLSYLTIELRGDIPEEHRAALGAHVYGCDVCQDVCPYNQAAPASDDPAWQPRPSLDRPRLADLWRMPDAELRRVTKGSAMTRAKLPALRRNVAVALANAGRPLDLEAADPARPSAGDPMVRRHVGSSAGTPPAVSVPRDVRSG
ncbi:MAG: tRNA epoxyqueuosine(34) reductase QueG [Acidimicrobiia bacterium]|nr:tRNA epoxyqueuosine(34) reductase QueG [Acidimicrobiia bacterium]